MIKFGVMSATEGTDSYSLDHPVNIFPSVRKSLFSGTALQETCIFILINLCLDFFLELISLCIQTLRIILSFLSCERKSFWERVSSLPRSSRDSKSLCGKSHHTHFICCLIPELISLAFGAKVIPALAARSAIWRSEFWTRNESSWLLTANPLFAWLPSASEAPAAPKHCENSAQLS